MTPADGNDTTDPIAPPPSTIKANGGIRQDLERAALRRLLGAVDGVTLVEDPHAVVAKPHGLGATEVPDRVTLTVRDPRAWSAVARSGSAGIGEGYFRSWWDTDDLVGLLRHLIRNVGGLDAVRSGSTRSDDPCSTRCEGSAGRTPSGTAATCARTTT